MTAPHAPAARDTTRLSSRSGEMRVAIVCPVSFSLDGFVGGGTRYPEELARAISKRTSCDFFVFGTKDDSFVDQHGLTHHLRRMPGGSPNADAFSLATLRQLHGYDVVHFHTVNKMAIAGAALLRSLRRKVFLTPLGGGQRTGLGRLRLDRLFTGFPVISDYTRVECPWVHRRPNTVIYGGGDAAGFPPNPVLQPRPSGPIVAIGRISAHKGLDVLIQALPPGRQLLICGHVLDHEYASHLRRLAAGKQVDFLPPADDRTISDLYSRAAVVVLPSLHGDFRGVTHRHPELLGLVLLEAMWHGVPVVASRAGGIPEIVIDGENGLLVRPGDAQALRLALTRLLEDSPLSSRLGQRGRELAESRYTWAHVAERTLSFYRDAGLAE